MSDKKWKQSPYGRYVLHHQRSRKRGIGFELTFEQWWGLWSRHFHKRGLKRGQYVMARNGDTGPYAVGNVKVVKTETNAVDRGINGKAHRGTANHAAKLCEGDIDRIRDILACGERPYHIGPYFGVTHQAVRAIATGKTWAHHKGAKA